MNPTDKKAITVLVVEDEAVLLDLNRFMLERCGYSVLVARDGVEALQIAQKYPGLIDLLLTDVRMPRMGGCELVAEFKTVSPSSKVLYMTGSSASSCAEDLNISPEYVLCKPVGQREFQDKVRSVLGIAE